MAYFQYLPNLLYRSLQQKGSDFDTAKVTNLFRRGEIRPDIFNTVIYFDRYSIKGNDRPDNVANEVYGSSEYDWIVLLSNNIINVRNEWPMDDNTFEIYIKSKYTNQERYQVKYYETTELRDIRNKLVRKKGIKVNLESYNDYSFSYFDGSTIIELNKSSLNSVTNYDYELSINEEKRNIYLLKPKFLTTTIDDLKNIMNYSDSSQYVDKSTKKTI